MPILLCHLDANVSVGEGCENNQFSISIEALSISMLDTLVITAIVRREAYQKNAVLRGRILALPVV